MQHHKQLVRSCRIDRDLKSSRLMKTLTFLATLILFLGSSLRSSAAPAVKHPAKSTDFQGAVTAITETSIAVKNDKGTTRTFVIYPGTVFGQRAKGKFSDFKVGDTVHVVFGESGGQAKAENIRNPADDKVKKPGKK